MRTSTVNKKVHTVPYLTQEQIFARDRAEVDQIIEGFLQRSQQIIMKNKLENAVAIEKAKQLLNKQKSSV